MGAKLRALHKTADLMNNEGGSVIIAALLVLVLLTISVIASTSVSNTEIQIAGHTVSYQQNFYRAEGAAMEAVGQLEALPDPLLDPPGWVPDLDQISDEDIRDWDENSLVQSRVAVSSLEDTQYLVVNMGTDENSVDMNKTTVYRYIIYGRCSPDKRGEAVVQIGYLKAF